MMGNHLLDKVAGQLRSFRWSGIREPLHGRDVVHLGTLPLEPAMVGNIVASMFLRISSSNAIFSVPVLLSCDSRGNGRFIETGRARNGEIPADRAGDVRRGNLETPGSEFNEHDMHIEDGRKHENGIKGKTSRQRMNDFQGLGIVDVIVAPPDLVFWSRYLRGLVLQGSSMAVTSGSLSPGLIVDFISGSTGIDFLGGGDTTNIVFKLENGGQAMVFKVYPRFSLNLATTVFGALEKCGFKNVVPLLHGISYPDDLVGEFCEIQGIDLGRVRASLNLETRDLPGMFPQLHVFPLVDSSSDGGLPFWNAALAIARGTIKAGDATAGVSSRVDVSVKLETLARVVAGYHSILAKSFPTNVVSMDNLYDEFLAKFSSRIESIFPILKRMENKVLGRLFEKVLGDWRHHLEQVRFSPGRSGQEGKHRVQVTHQDLHLQQFMIERGTGKFLLLDLEGDPQATWMDKVSLYPVEKDLASLLRSFSYIKFNAYKEAVLSSGLLDPTTQERFSVEYPLYFVKKSLSGDIQSEIDTFTGDWEEIPASTSAALDSWERDVSRRLISLYSATSPVSEWVLGLSMVARTLDELSYELQYRPWNALLPLASYLQLVKGP